jgi:Thermolysin metallopeptidase, alpha-helical domain/Thermolysin metallopeptidase, catalytic domain
MAMSTRRRLQATACLAALTAAACVSRPSLGDDDAAAKVLVVSDAWRATVTAEEFQQRVTDLQQSVDRLRSETSSGWVGRQDDVTGYLADLSGGSFRVPGPADAPSAATALLDTYGPDLFGIGGGDIAFISEEVVPDRPVVLRAEQRLGEVPVLDGVLTVSVAVGAAEASVRSARGRVFPGLSPAAQPTIALGSAVLAAEEASRGSLQGDARLVVVPDRQGGKLAWEVPVAGAIGVELGIALYFIDATTGAVLSVRPAAADLTGMSTSFSARSVLGAGLLAVQAGETVTVTGTGPIGEALEAVGRRAPDGGIELIDTTTPTYDPSTGRGAIETRDATFRLPGRLVRSVDTVIGDPEALAAHAYSRYVFDYYLQNHGRQAWDGQGGTSTASVHELFTPCNAYFNGSQVVFGIPCNDWARTMVDVDVVAHEWTHGVTDTTAGLLYLGQSGALNESFSDYFGNVIGDLWHDQESARVAEGLCKDFTAPTPLCEPSPEGLSMRYMLNGATLEDYLYLVATPLLLTALHRGQDNGGVHLNSAVWNNALWSIRSQLARIDGVDGTDSALGREFDAIVYAALTRHLGPSSGFLDARAAVEAAAVERGTDPTILRVIRDTFDQNSICAGCVPPPGGDAIPVATLPAGEARPAASADRVAWVDFSTGTFVTGAATVATPGGAPQRLTDRSDVVAVAFAGDALVTAELPGGIVRYDGSGGAPQPLDEQIGDSLFIGVAGSEEGAAWANLEAGGLLRFVDTAGQVHTASLPAEITPDDFVAIPWYAEPSESVGGVASIGAGGGTVALGTASGKVIAWRQGSDPSVVAAFPGQILAIGAHGDRVVAITVGQNDTAGTAVLIDLASGQETVLSTRAMPFGLAVSDRYVVWAEQLGELSGRVADIFSYGSDTDLYLYSFGSGRFYDVLPRRGQQAFPALAEDLLVWQDAGNGGDDVYAGRLPTDL